MENVQKRFTKWSTVYAITYKNYTYDYEMIWINCQITFL